jgi:L-ascorbate metabolism protein UlaG (beta-lactamase superfamily)
MKKLLAVILTTLLISPNVFSQSTEHKIDVTYIANAGFLIESSGKKILIDAIFNNGWNNYLTPGDFIVSKIINQQSPFNKVNLMLITHNHADHFNDSMVVAYLNNNSENILIAPTLVTTTILKNPDFKNKNQVVELDRINREKNDTTINGIRIRSFFILHDSRPQIEHVGFLIDIGDIKVFHSGDSNGSDSVEFEELQLQKEQIDLALLNFYGFWNTKEERLFTEKYILPKRISLIHIPPKEVKSVMDSVKLIRDFIDITVFESSMQKKSFIYESSR